MHKFSIIDKSKYYNRDSASTEIVLFKWNEVENILLTICLKSIVNIE